MNAIGQTLDLAYDLPPMRMPDVKMPNIKLPNVNLPKVELPKVDTSKAKAAAESIDDGAIKNLGE